ncbi:hypothetical protein [Actinokineospora pegani]|uniref:hypothetical protein n=1 Tax=Actinokineospora pegani TaxID=2654637 RepID=UPI0012EB017E|nr:hypothetical protein [Actinokineospora pegani]
MTGGPRSTTRKTLSRLRFGLVAGSGLVLATALATLLGIRSDLAEVRERTAPAVLEVSLAKEALVSAHRAAVSAFDDGHARLTGPGERYEDEIARTSQQLAQVAEHNAAGAPGSRTLRLVEGLLPTYNGFIGQADAHFRQDAGGPLAAHNLLSASALLTADQNGILAQLDALGAAQREALREQLDDGWLHPAVMLVWAAPLLVLLVALWWAQRFLAARFRRSLNPALLAATATLLLLGVAMSFLAGARSGAGDSAAALARAVDARSAATAAEDVEAQRTLVQVVQAQCGGPGAVTCGDTVAAFAAAAPSTEPVAPSPEVDRSAPAGAGFAEPPWSGALGAGVLVSALGAGVLIVVGLQPRIDEYWFRRARGRADR